jgi:hypothetical protein
MLGLQFCQRVLAWAFGLNGDLYQIEDLGQDCLDEWVHVTLLRTQRG